MISSHLNSKSKELRPWLFVISLVRHRMEEWIGNCRCYRTVLVYPFKEKETLPTPARNKIHRCALFMFMEEKIRHSLDGNKNRPTPFLFSWFPTGLEENAFANDDPPCGQ
jgi:hypothetical protein